MTATETGDVLFDSQLVFVPLVVQVELFTLLDVARGEQADVVQHLRVGLPRQVEGLDVGIATVIYKTCLIAVEHCVQTQREKLFAIRLLNLLLPRVARLKVVHVKEV